MDRQYLQHLIDTLTDKDNLKLCREEAISFHKSHTVNECFDMAVELYASEHFQIQDVAVFLLGYIAVEKADALSFLKDIVSIHPSWKVQEVLAMAFDAFCKAHGYKESIPIMHEWICNDNANTRRAVTEGLRIWTSRPFFKDNPEKAIELIASLKDDESEYVRKSVGNSLRDISKKFPDLVKAELLKWDLSSKRVSQVYRLAGKLVLE
jgi:3-methyladenine DNA glycosylase AlkC